MRTCHWEETCADAPLVVLYFLFFPSTGHCAVDYLYTAREFDGRLRDIKNPFPISNSVVTTENAMRRHALNHVLGPVYRLSPQFFRFQPDCLQSSGQLNGGLRGRSAGETLRCDNRILQNVLPRCSSIKRYEPFLDSATFGCAPQVQKMLSEGNYQTPLNHERLSSIYDGLVIWADRELAPTYSTMVNSFRSIRSDHQVETAFQGIEYPFDNVACH